MLTEKYENEIIKSITNRLLEENKLSKELHTISDIKSFFKISVVVGYKQK